MSNYTVKASPKKVAELRWAMVEFAWRCLKGNAYWKARCETFQKRRPPKQAITAVARHLLVIAWHLLSKREPYRQVTEERITYKFLTWSWQLNEHQRKGLTRAQFVRYDLLRLGIGTDLNRIALNPKYPYRIAPVAEVLALKPELKPPPG